jgi:hypothetical protein
MGGRMSLPQELRNIGIELVPIAEGFLADCPFHSGATGQDAVTVAQDDDGWFFKCFTCGAFGFTVEDWEAWANP